MNKQYKYTPIIGLEVHVELGTRSKMFCACAADWFGKEPNTQTCPVCLGLPGALPVPNKKAVDWTIMLGMALNCKIAAESHFDRKNYFYPDLPKGYQISQYDKPLAKSGWMKIRRSKLRHYRITRVHLEEDTGKLLHNTINGDSVTLIDFNRSGMPLVEIVTEPDIRSSEEAVLVLKKLRQIVRYLGISDANMEMGSMRIEPNVSVLTPTDSRHYSEARQGRAATNAGDHKGRSYKLPGYKVEIKNINSFRFAKRAIDYEIERQISMFKRGNKPIQETRGWEEKKQKTVAQRTKEEAHDYRYFPEPDIPPMHFDKPDLNRLKADIPELPDAKAERFIQKYGLSDYDAGILTMESERADYYEKAVKEGLKKKIDAKTIANWIINKRVNLKKTSPSELINAIKKETAKAEYPQEELKKIIQRVLKKSKGAVEDYRGGKKEALGYLVGQVMQKTKGKADAKKIKAILKEEL